MQVGKLADTGTGRSPVSFYLPEEVRKSSPGAANVRHVGVDLHGWPARDFADKKAVC
jgi:hypothetical protein